MTQAPNIDYTNVIDNINLFTRYMGLNSESNPSVDIANELDAMYYLTFIPDMIKETSRIDGFDIYRNTPYDFIDDVKKSLDFQFLQHKYSEQNQALRRKNLTVFHFVLIPTIELFSQLTKSVSIQCCDAIISNVIALLQNSTGATSISDATEAHQMIREKIRDRERIRKSPTIKKRVSKK